MLIGIYILLIYRTNKFLDTFLLQKYFSPSTQEDAERSGSTLAQKNNVALVRHCLNVLKNQFDNVYNFNDHNASLENTVLFSETIRQNITSVVSITIIKVGLITRI